MHTLKILVSGMASGGIYLCFYPIALSLLPVKPHSFPGLEGPYKPNQELKNVELIAVPTPGPESIVQDSLGIFIPTRNGDLLYFDAQAAKYPKQYRTSFGYEIFPNGQLIIVDQKKD